MKAQPMKNEGNYFIPCAPSEATHLMFKFANENGERRIPVQIKGSRAGTGNWTWNGCTEKPTVRPSIATNFGNGLKCHVWLNDGEVQHLGDCTCGLSGKTEDLEDLID